MLLCSCYRFVAEVFSQRSEVLAVNLGLFSISTVNAIANLVAQCSMKMLTIVAVVVFAMGMVLVSVEYQSVIRMTELFPPSVLDNRPVCR